MNERRYNTDLVLVAGAGKCRKAAVTSNTLSSVCLFSSNSQRLPCVDRPLEPLVEPSMVFGVHWGWVGAKLGLTSILTRQITLIKAASAQTWECLLMLGRGEDVLSYLHARHGSLAIYRFVAIKYESLYQVLNIAIQTTWINYQLVS